MDMTASGPGAPARRRSEARQRTELVALRLLPGERDQLAAAARRRKISLSELLRSSALDAIASGRTHERRPASCGEPG
jgi:hypothetical protein